MMLCHFIFHLKADTRLARMTHSSETIVYPALSTCQNIYKGRLFEKQERGQV